MNTLQPDHTSSTSDPGQSTSRQNQLERELPLNQNNQSRLNSNQPSLLTSDSQPGPSRPNQNLGMSCDPIIFTEPHNSGGSNTYFNAIDPRLQEVQSPEKISSVFEPISAHIPVKIKEKIWNGEFIELGVLLKSNRDLVNESNLDGELSVKGRVLSIVNKKSTPIKNIHIWTSAFMIYATITLEKWPSKGLELMKYMQTVRMAATREYAEGWFPHDEQYRLHKSHSPSSWGVVDMELWMLLVCTPKTSPTFDSGFPKQQYQSSNNPQSDRSL